MRVASYGRIIQKNMVRIYFYSDVGPLRPVFHKLYSVLKECVRDDASCDVIFLTNKKNQYHQLHRFTDQSLWEVLKYLRNVQTSETASRIHLEEDLSGHRGAQSIIIKGTGTRSNLEEVLNFNKATTTGITFITLD